METTQRTQLHVTGMVCDACASHVEKALKSVAGVRSVRVEREAQRATAEHVGADKQELLAAVADAGYQAEVEQDS